MSLYIYVCVKQTRRIQNHTSGSNIYFVKLMYFIQYVLYFINLKQIDPNSQMHML